MPQTIVPGQVAPVHPASEVAKRARMSTNRKRGDDRRRRNRAIGSGPTPTAVHALESRSDERLVAMVRAGSERAYEEILRRYRRQLHSYCAQMLGPSRAEDAVQQAFLQAFIALQRGGNDRKIALRPWLYRISHNCSIDMLRKNGWDYDELDPEYDGVPQPPRLFEQKQELEKLVESLRRLPESQRRALTLRELEGKSYGEIAAELGHTDSGIRQLIFRARTTLRNAAAVLFPIGALRAKFAQHASSATDAHQAAFAATISADQAGAGLASAAAALLAGVSLLTGGPVDKSHDQHATRPASTAFDASLASGSHAAKPSGIAVVPNREAGRSGKSTKVVDSGSARVVDQTATAAPTTAAAPPEAQTVAPAAPQPSTTAHPNGSAGSSTGAPSSGAGPADSPSKPSNGSTGKNKPNKKENAKTDTSTPASQGAAGKQGKTPKTVVPKQTTQKEKAPKQSSPKQSVPKQSVPKQSVPKQTAQKPSAPKAVQKPSNAPKQSVKAPSKSVGGSDPSQAKAPSPTKGQGTSKGNGPARGSSLQ